MTSSKSTLCILRFSQPARLVIMSVPSKHILHQGPVIGAFLQSAVGVAKQSLLPASRPTTTPPVPDPVFEHITRPLPDSLSTDYIQEVRGETNWSRRIVPAPRFPPSLF